MGFDASVFVVSGGVCSLTHLGLWSPKLLDHYNYLANGGDVRMKWSTDSGHGFKFFFCSVRAVVSEGLESYLSFVSIRGCGN